MITVASEVMAILCLAADLDDLKKRFGDILVAYSYAGKPIYARDLHAEGAMTALMKDAIKPNLIQTLEGTPCSDARRSVRQYRARLQQRAGNQAGAQAG